MVLRMVSSSMICMGGIFGSRIICVVADGISIIYMVTIGIDGIGRERESA